MNLKIVGICICVIGSIIASVYVPVKSFGQYIGHFFGGTNMMFGITTWNMMDTTTLMLELIFINGVGLALVAIGVLQEKKS